MSAALHLQRPPAGPVSDNWMTPREAWIAIDAWLPKDKVISDPFFCDGVSGRTMRELGCTVVHENLDFFRYDFGEVVVTNPPFSLKKEVFAKLVERNKPFIMICPANVISTKYIRELFDGSAYPLKLIIPYKRIYFDKPGCAAAERERPNFDCYYYCWQMGPRDVITWSLTDAGASQNQSKRRVKTKGKKRKRAKGSLKRVKKAKRSQKANIRDFFT